MTGRASCKWCMVSRIARFDELGVTLRRYSKGAIGLLIGIPILEQLFEDQWYMDLDGGMLEAFGRLFQRDVKLLVYPTVKTEAPDIIVTTENVYVSIIIDINRIRTLREVVGIRQQFQFKLIRGYLAN